MGSIGYIPTAKAEAKYFSDVVIVLDISGAELPKAPDTYHKVLADIASSDFDISDRYDLIISKMLAEHISDAEQFH